jgi:hypothetical protein
VHDLDTSVTLAIGRSQNAASLRPETSTVKGADVVPPE